MQQQQEEENSIFSIIQSILFRPELRITGLELR